jgi:hypothetical protein
VNAFGAKPAAMIVNNLDELFTQKQPLSVDSDKQEDLVNDGKTNL